MKTFCYLVSWSEVETVPVGTYLIDFEEKDSEWRGLDRRVWTLYDSATGEFRDGWAGRKLDRLCTRCRKDYRKAALNGHEGLHGYAPKYVPTAAPEPVGASR